MVKPVKVCALDDLPQRRAVSFSAGQVQVALCRIEDKVYGFEDRCSHAFKSLAGARVRGDTLMCPHHGARFDLATGAHICAPAVRGIQTFDTQIEDGAVHVLLPDDLNGEVV